MVSRLSVLIADDSPTARQLMAHMINATADMSVIAEASSGKQAVQMSCDLRPDVILMDIVMPGLNGLDATREIMKVAPTPIVMVTASLESHETDIAFEAIRLGALAVMKKPVGLRRPDFSAQSSALANTVRAMAGVHVIHHHQPDDTAYRLQEKLPVAQRYGKPEIVAIVSSTGGPAALSEIFKRLKSDFDLPVVVVQHISPEFLPSLVEWLSSVTPLSVEIARAGGQPLPGHIYFAPGDAHLCLSRNRRFEFHTHTTTPYIPSGDILMDSVATSYGSNAIGVLLTGMGSDGARGLHAMYSAGAYTIAQDRATSVVFGMPQEAIALGAARAVLPIQAVAQAVIEFSRSGVEVLT